MGFQWSLNDRKSPQVSRTLLGIMVDLDNAIIWIISTFPLISKSTSPFTNPLEIILSALITIHIIITFIFSSIFQLSSKVYVLISLFTFFQFFSVIRRDGYSSIRQIFFFSWLSQSLVVWPRLGDLLVSNPPLPLTTTTTTTDTAAFIGLY